MVLACKEPSSSRRHWRGNRKPEDPVRLLEQRSPVYIHSGVEDDLKRTQAEPSTSQLTAHQQPSRFLSFPLFFAFPERLRQVAQWPHDPQDTCPMSPQNLLHSFSTHCFKPARNRHILKQFLSDRSASIRVVGPRHL